MPGYSQQEDFCIHPKVVTLTWSSGESYQHRCPQGSAQSGSSQKIWLSYWSQYSVWLLWGSRHWTADISSCNSKKHVGLIHVLLFHLWLMSACSPLDLQTKFKPMLTRQPYPIRKIIMSLQGNGNGETRFLFSMLTLCEHTMRMKEILAG